MRRLPTTLCFALVLALGCGDPLVEGDYRGQPLIELGGTIHISDTLSPEDSDRVRVGLLWVNAAQQGDLKGSAESSFPARYSMRVFARPPDRAMQVLPDRSGLHAVARIVLFLDDDGDDQLDSLERVVGAAPNQVLTYFTSSEPTALVRGPVRSGYQVMEVFDCDQRLEDKAAFGPVDSLDTVDLTLAAGVANSLLDFDCDTVSDDLCYELRLQVQEDPTNQERVQLYQDLCEVSSEPEFNNTAAAPPNPDGTDPNATPGTDPDRTCDQFPDQPECNDPNGNQSTQDAIAQCRPLLGDALSPNHEQMREAYWRFRSCAGPFDPCGELDWNGSLDGWEQYQMCIFEVLPEHHQEWCGSIMELMANAGADDQRVLEEELIRGGCADGNF